MLPPGPHALNLHMWRRSKTRLLIEDQCYLYRFITDVGSSVSLDWNAGCLRTMNRYPVEESSSCLQGTYVSFYDGLLVDVDTHEDEYCRKLK